MSEVDGTLVPSLTPDLPPYQWGLPSGTLPSPRGTWVTTTKIPLGTHTGPPVPPLTQTLTDLLLVKQRGDTPSYFSSVTNTRTSPIRIPPLRPLERPSP